MYRGLILTFLALVAHHGIFAGVVQQLQQQSSPSNTLSSFADVFEASDSAERTVNDMFRFIQDESISTADNFNTMQNRLKDVIEQQYKRGLGEIQGWKDMPVLSDFRDRITNAFSLARNNLVNAVKNAGQQSLNSLQNVDQSDLPQAVQNARRSFENKIATPLRNYLRALNGIGVGENGVLPQLSSISDIRNKMSNFAQKMQQPSKMLERRAEPNLADTFNKNMEIGDDTMNSIQSMGTKISQRLANRLRTFPDYLDGGVDRGNGLLKSALSMGKQMRRQGYDQIQSLSDMVLSGRRQSESRGNTIDEEPMRRRGRFSTPTESGLRTERTSNNGDIETKVDFESDSLQRRSVPTGNDALNMKEMASKQMLRERDLTTIANDEGNNMREQVSDLNGNQQRQRVPNRGNGSSQLDGSGLESTMLESGPYIPQSLSTSQMFEGRDLNGMINNEKQRTQGQVSEMSGNLTKEGRRRQQQVSDLGNQFGQNLDQMSDQNTNLMKRGVEENAFNSIPISPDVMNQIDRSSLDSMLQSGMNIPQSFSTSQMFEGRDLNGMINNERQQTQGHLSEMSGNLTKEGRRRQQQVSDLGNQFGQNLDQMSDQNTNLIRRGIEDNALNSIPFSPDVSNKINRSSLDSMLQLGMNIPQSFLTSQMFESRDSNGIMNERQQTQGQLSETSGNMVQGSGFGSVTETSLKRRGVDELSTSGLDSVSNLSSVGGHNDCKDQISNIEKTTTSATNNIPKSEMMGNVAETENLANDIQNIPESDKTRSGPL